MEGLKDISDAESMKDEVDGKIGCRVCGARVHAMQIHLREEHPEISLADYCDQFPGAPVLSDRARALAEQKRAAAAASAVESEKAPDLAGFKVTKTPMNELFGLGRAKAALSHRGTEIPVTLMSPPEEVEIYVPEKDSNYIFNIDLLKTVLLGLENNYPVYLWGHAGVGKTTVLEQICAYTRRPWMRVQHTRNTEEAHVLGQWIVKDGQTVFELGPLPYAMKHGLTYVADEYDFAMASVLSLYQPVLEGKALVIKDADRENRIIKPHPLFRFCATGNTNGTGDETGLYAGTLIQNAANYERFAIVEEVRYPERKVELGIVAGQGGIKVEEAERLVSFGAAVREAFTNGKIGLPISPRALIHAAQIGKRRGSSRVGLMLAYVNRLSRTDQQAVTEMLDRMAL